MTVIGLYLSRLFAVRLAAVLVTFTVLLQLMDLLDNATTVLANGGPADLVVYVALRTPLAFTQLIPFAVLIATLLTFLNLARHNEITALRAAGMTLRHALGLMLPIATTIAALHFLLIDQVSPQAERAFRVWWADFAPGTDSERDASELIWLRSGSDIIAASSVSSDGQRLEDVLIVRRDDRGRASETIWAAAALHDMNGWRLRDARVYRPAPADQNVRVMPSMPWPSGPDPANVAAVTLSVESVSTAQALRILSKTWSGTQSPAYYRTQLHSIFAVALTTPVMMLLAAPVAFGAPRRRPFGLPTMVSLGAGLLYLVTHGLLTSLGETGVLPAPLAAWAATALFACVGGFLLLNAEES